MLDDVIPVEVVYIEDEDLDYTVSNVSIVDIDKDSYDWEALEALIDLDL